MTNVPISFDHCVINVSSRAVSDDFYARVLGAEVIAPRPDFRFYRFGDMQLNVHGPDVHALPHQLARDPVRPGNSDICFEWHGPIDGAIAHLEACGVAVETGPVRTAGCKGGGISVYFRDPDGSLLEFITYPDLAASQELPELARR